MMELLSQLNAAIEHDPGRDKNYYRRGLYYAERKQWSEAEADFAQAFSLWTDPAYLDRWRNAARERQEAQSLDERMAPYAKIINKIKNINGGVSIDESETASAPELIAAMALYEEYELLETLFVTNKFTPDTLNKTVSVTFAWWQPTPLFFITTLKSLERMNDPHKMIRFLASYGALPNVPAGDGSTMLWNQCNEHLPDDIMETLLEIGADPNQINRDDEGENVPLVYTLRPLDVKDSDGNPIEGEYQALSSKSMIKAKRLLLHKADPNLANPSLPDYPPLMLAIRFGPWKMEKGWHVGPQLADLIETMLECGADPNFTDSEGDTPLLIAADMGLRNLGELLLLYGAKMPESRAYRGLNPPDIGEVCP